MATVQVPSGHAVGGPVQVVEGLRVPPVLVPRAPGEARPSDASVALMTGVPGRHKVQGRPTVVTATTSMYDCVGRSLQGEGDHVLVPYCPISRLTSLEASVKE